MTAIPSSFRSKLSDRAPGRLVCAWCEKDLVEVEPALDLPRDSHGICADCALKHFGLDLRSATRE